MAPKRVLSKIVTGDQEVDRLQDHLRAVINPALEGLTAVSSSVVAAVQQNRVALAGKADVSFGNVPPGSVPGAVIQPGSITGGQLANATITGDQIQQAAISARHIENASITSDQIASLAIRSENIGNAEITSDNIGNAAISGTNIASATITGQNIATGTISGTNIADASITGQQIGTAAISGNNIGTAAVSGTNIGNATIQGTNIGAATISGTNIAAATISGTNLAGATITGDNIAAATISGTNIAGATILGTNISNTTISGSNIALATIVSDNLGTFAVSASNLGSGSVTANSVAANAIVAGSIAAGAVTAGAVAAAAISGGNIIAGSISGTSLAASTISGTNIAASTISGTNIAANSIMASNILVTAENLIPNGNNAITGGLPSTAIELRSMSSAAFGQAGGFSSNGFYRTGTQASTFAPCDFVQCSPGQTFIFSMRIGMTGTLVSQATDYQIIDLTFYKADKTSIVGFNELATIGMMTGTSFTSSIVVTVTGTAPALSAYVQPSLQTFLAVADRPTGKMLMGELVLKRMTDSGLLTADSIKTSNYAETNLTATAGAKLDITGTALKCAANNLQVGAYTMTDPMFRSINALANSGTGASALAWYRGNIDTTVNNGAPVLIDNAWQQSTAYAVGARVTGKAVGINAYPVLNYGTGSSSSLHVYKCTTAGTSSASGTGPSGTNPDPDTWIDNTAKWQWVGAMPASTLASSPGGSIFTYGQRNATWISGSLFFADPLDGVTYPLSAAGGVFAGHYVADVVMSNSLALTNQPGQKSIYRVITGGNSSASSSLSGTGTNLQWGGVTASFVKENTMFEERIQPWMVAYATASSGFHYYFQFIIQPKDNDDNLDSLRRLELEIYDQSGVPAQSPATANNYQNAIFHVIPITDRLYRTTANPDQRSNRSIASFTINTKQLHAAVTPFGMNSATLRIRAYNAAGYSTRDYGAMGNYLPTPFYGGSTLLAATPLTGGGGDSGGGGGTCPVWNTPIQVSESGEWKFAGDLQVGDTVWTYPESGTEPGLFPVTAVTHAQRMTYYLRLDNGWDGFFSENHRFYVSGTWVPVQDLRPGDVTEHGGTVVESRPSSQDLHVVRLTISGAATYLTPSGGLQHNAKPL